MNKRLGFCCVLYRCCVVELVVLGCPRKNFRSSHQRCFIKKVVLKNFAIFTGKHMCWRYFIRSYFTLCEGVILFQTENIKCALLK